MRRPDPPQQGDLLDDAGDAPACATTSPRSCPRAVKVVETAHGRVDPALVLGLDAAAEADLAARPSHHETAEDHDHDDFESVALPLGPADAPEALAARIARAAEAAGVLRLKGFAAVDGRPLRLVVQGVGRRVTHHFDRPWRAGEPRAGRLVVIGLKGFDRAAVAAALAGIDAPPPGHDGFARRRRRGGRPAPAAGRRPGAVVRRQRPDRRSRPRTAA